MICLNAIRYMLVARGSYVVYRSSYFILLCRKHLRIVILNEVKNLALPVEQFILLPTTDPFRHNDLADQYVLADYTLNAVR